MNIPQEYKQTELGIIPEDWEVTTIKQIADITTGNKNTQDAEEGGKYPFYVRSQNVERINNYSYDCEGVVTAGDGVGTGKIFHYVRGKFGLHQRAYLIYNFKDFDSQYFYWYFSQYFYDRINQMTAKSSVDSVRKEMIEDMCILRAPIAEQRAIAEALSDVDGLIAALDKKIAKKRLLKQGAMQQLLTGKKRLPGFTDEWVEKTLGEIGTLSMCKRIFQEETSDSGDVPFYKIGTFGQEADAFISKAKYESYKNMYRFPSKGDILISAAGTIGRTVVYDGKPAYFQDSNIIWLAHTQKHILNIYLSYVYQIINWNIENTTIARLYNDNFNNTVVLFPKSLVEQQAIATILSNMDKEIADLEALRDKYRLLKSGMMQKLLTGQIRLKTE